jgi:hypothetical protein
VHRHNQNFSFGGGVADPEGVHKICLILKTVLWKSRQNLRADIWLDYREIKTNWKKYIFVSFYYIFHYSNVLVISNVGGWFRLKRKSHKSFDIVMSAKPVILNFCLGRGGLPGSSPPSPFWLRQCCGNWHIFGNICLHIQFLQNHMLEHCVNLMILIEDTDVRLPVIFWALCKEFQDWN